MAGNGEGAGGDRRDSDAFDRRRFLQYAVAGAGGAAAAGFASGWALASSPSETPAASPTPGGTISHADMDRLHKAAVDAFLANAKKPITKGVGAQDLSWKMEGVTRVFALECKPVRWEVTPGTLVDALSYNGMVPGPTIRVVEGQPVRVHVRNNLDQSTSVHWHGQRVKNAMDGVPYVTQEPIQPGGEFTYEFTPGPFGSHMYHSHHNSAEQVGRGLLGALLVEPRDRKSDPAYDKEYLFILNDTLGGFTINGKGFPATAAYSARQGQRVRFRFMNEGQMIHPIHLHGLTMEIFARDGYPLAQPFRCDTITVAPGERWDAIVVADNPGVWAFHCHILSHAEGPTGMFGMVTALVVA